MVEHAGTHTGTVVIQPRGGEWVISRNQDLIWLQGSVLTGLALLLCFLSVPGLNSTNYLITHPAVLILLFWGVFFDGTHVWATYARTYFANDATSRAGLPGPSAWLILLVGPLLAIVDYAFFAPGPSIVGEAGSLFRHFLVLAYLWAYYHLIRQHYGLMVLYNRKSGIARGRLDVIFLWAASIYPYARFSFSDAYIASGLPHVFPAAWFDTARTALDIAFLTTMLVLLVCWLRQRKSNPVPIGPKHLFVFIVVSFHMLVFALLDNLLAITATLTIFHNFQYHRIVWQYEQGKGRIPMGALSRYLCIGVLFGALWYGPRVMGVAIAEANLMVNILLGLGWGVAFHHYIVDARIWRVRKNPDIAQAIDKGAA